MLSWRWNLVALFAITLVLIPILVVLSYLPFIDKETLLHLSRYVLPRYIWGSFVILVGVIVLTFILGVSTAYLIAFYRFFGSRVLEWALILPLAIPAYIMGFVWVSLCEYQGFIPTLLGLERRIDIMNVWGTTLLLSFSLYPYVYFFVKNNFSKNLGNIILSAQTLSHSPFKIFYKIILPFCRLSIIGALSLVGMETLSEYGLVAYFGVDTFSAGIFRTWLGGGDEASGIALSAALIVCVFIFLLLESYERGNRGYANHHFIDTPKQKLGGFRGFMAFLWCFMVLLFAFIIPMIWLLYWGFYDISQSFDKFATSMWYSLSASFISAFCIVLVSLYLCFVVRFAKGAVAKIILKVTSLGYAIPGAVVAIGILLFLGFINTKILEPLHVTYALGGGFGILVFGYLIRFLASGIFAMESGFAKIPKSFDYSALSLKVSPLKLLWRIHIPLLSSSMALAFVIIAIDILKELPISTILASSGFQTLSAAAFGYSENEQIYDAAFPSVLIVLFGLIPTFLMHYLEKHSYKNREHNG